MSTKWLASLKALVSPLALGIYITLTFVWLCFMYYTSRDLGLQGNFITQGIQRAHETSIDYRLLARGPVESNAPVVLLTVDEKAIDTLGRWPWPRALIARAVQRAAADGAKVLGFDIIFSESERNELLSTSHELFAKGLIDQNLMNKMSALARAQDGDALLAKVFEQHQHQIVGGTFYRAYNDQSFPPGQIDYCYDLVFKMSEEFKIWDQEEALISVQDPYQHLPPYAIQERFNEILNERATRIRSEFGENLSSSKKVQLKEKIHQALHETCTHLFKTAEKSFDKIWVAQILSQLNPSEFQFKTYSDWLRDFESRLKPNGIPRADHWELNIPTLSRHLVHNGYFNAQQDTDGTIRSSPLVTRTGFFVFPSLALKTYLVGKDRNASLRLEFNPATGRKEISKFEVTDNNTGEVVETIPTDGQGRLLINYAGPQKMFPYLSFADLLSDSNTLTVQQRVFDENEQDWVIKDLKVPRKEFLKGKYLLVGVTAMGVFDLRVTPFEKKTYPGLETHANVLANLLERNFLRPLQDERSQMPFFLLLLGVSHTLLLSQLGAMGGMLATLGLIAGILGIDKYALFDQGLVVTIVWPLFLLLTTYLILTTYRYLTEERGKKELRKTFQKYVSPSIVEEILSHPKNIELGGKKMNLTVFFSDVRGFTTISEKLDPHALTQLLNEYLTPMTEIVFNNQGTLDKYMGDAIMAFFGAPIPYEKHAHFACRAALQSLEKLKELQKDFANRGLPQIDIGIGLNSGEVSAGNMGSKTVRSYTVMGDAVNLASRLEGINKQYGTRIIISEYTEALVRDLFTCREIDWVRVKGKTKPVKIFELLAEGPLTGAAATHLEIYNTAYTHYRNQNWIEAQEFFSKALDLNPIDEVSRLFLSRCANYIDSPPDTGWDGVFEMKTK